ncbi:MAG: hypothetical protein BWK74_05470 [Desulfobacteraceae bacterium A6]|nr:MAG: hypothetical protein BWK74_05470 [Desulfobacteraceae bacterium A6]
MNCPSKSSEHSSNDIEFLNPNGFTENEKEYGLFLKEVFKDGSITPEELLALAHRKKELGIDRDRDVLIQKSIAREIGISIDEESDLSIGDLLMEVNANTTCYAGDNCHLEFRLSNISGDTLCNIRVIGNFVNLKITEESQYHDTRLAAAACSKRLIILTFSPEKRGTEFCNLMVLYEDARKNPSIYGASLPFQVFDRQPGSARDGNKSISITITAEKILGNDFSGLAEISGKNADSKKDSDKPLNSFLKENEKSWHWLPLFFNEDETNRLRKELLIRKKFSEGADHFSRAQKYRKEVESYFPQDRKDAKAKLQQAKDAFLMARGCFLKILEIDNNHNESLEKSREVEDGLEKIQAMIGNEVDQSKQAVKLTSALITGLPTQEKVYLYSKPIITIGRDNKNDIVLRVEPCLPQDKYPDNFTKSLGISSEHAKITIENGYLYLQDWGGERQFSKYGTFLNGRKVGREWEQFPLHDGCRIDIAGVLELGCRFLWNIKKQGREYRRQDSCLSVLGDISDSCFGIDKQGAVNAVRITRINNFSRGAEYIIIIREVTIGRSAGNGIVIDDESVSDIHAKIFYRGDRYWIEDLNSRHGTKVNDAVIGPGKEIPLEMQARISIGNTVLDFAGRK